MSHRFVEAMSQFQFSIRQVTNPTGASILILPTQHLMSLQKTRSSVWWRRWTPPLITVRIAFTFSLRLSPLTPDPEEYWDHSLPTNRARSLGMLRTHITAAMADPGGEIYVAEDDSNGTKEIVGVATWHGPGSAFLSTCAALEACCFCLRDGLLGARREAQRVDWDPMYAELDQPSKDFWDKVRLAPRLQSSAYGVSDAQFLPMYAEYTTKAFGEGVKLAGYHLQALGVHPTHWQRGIGRALIKIGEEKVWPYSGDCCILTLLLLKAKAEKVCCCIETVGHTAVSFNMQMPAPLHYIGSYIAWTDHVLRSRGV